MEQIKATFARCKEENRSALVTYVTAGYPTVQETPDIMLGMEAGGAGTATIPFLHQLVLFKTNFVQTSLSSVFLSQIRLQMVPRYKSRILLPLRMESQSPPPYRWSVTPGNRA